MKTTVRTIMNARANQRRRSLLIQGFKCNEIEHKDYLSKKRLLDYIENRIKDIKENLDKPVDRRVNVYSERKIKLEKEVKEFEKKHSINQEPRKPVKPTIEGKGFMSNVRSFFSRRKR